MATISSLTAASSIDPTADYLPIVTANINTTQKINRNTLLGITSSPVGISDTQTLTSKTLTSPTISGPTLSGTVTGTYTLGGTPTFPSTVVLTTGTQTLSGKTLTSPTINSPTITNASITADTLTGYTTTNSGTIYGISVSGGQITSALTLTQPLTVSTITSSGLVTASNGLTANGTITFPNSSLSPVMINNPYNFYYSIGANATILLNTATTLTCLTKVYDTGNNYSTTTGSFTAPVAGFYQFNGQVDVLATSSGSYIWASLFKNGSEFFRGNRQIPGTGGSAAAVSVSVMLQLAANDTIQLGYYSGVATTTENNSGTFLQGYLVSLT